MANRFWVKRADIGSNGSGVWGATQIAHWSATSGGAGGQPVPTSIDNVFFDNHSGVAAANIVVDGQVRCNTLTLQSSFLGDILATSDGTILPFGNIALGGNSINCPVRVMDSCVISSAGGKFLKYLNIQPATTGQTTTIAGALNVANTLYFRAGNLLTQGNDITCSAFAADQETFPATLNMGLGGTWTITGAGQSWKVIPGISVINSGGTIIKLTDATATTKSFSGGNATYGTLQLVGAGTGAYMIMDQNTFAAIINDVSPHTILFHGGQNTTISTAAGLQLSGEVGKRNVLASDAPPTQWGLVCNSGDVRLDFVSIKDCITGGTSQFLANSSINAGNNTAGAGGTKGWRFNSNEQFFSLL